MNRSTPSVADKLILAAYQLEEEGRRPFSAEDLVVAAWKKYPDTFGLAGYRGQDGGLLYPDSNRVFAEIMGTKPVRQRGLLIKSGNKIYQLTEAGREHARILLNQMRVSSSEKAGLGRDIQFELKRLLQSKALEKHRSGRDLDITFHDACAFWGVSPRSSAIELEGRFNNFSRILLAAREASQGKTMTFEHGGHSYSAADLDNLGDLHAFLIRKFESELAVIQKRTDERRTKGTD